MNIHEFAIDKGFDLVIALPISIALPILYAHLEGSLSWPLVVVGLLIFVSVVGVIEFVRYQKNARTGALIVHYADYGFGQDYCDVTESVQKRMHQGRITVRAHHDDLAIRDPCQNTPKELRVHYSFAGEKCCAIVPEGRVLDIPPLPYSS